MSTRLLGSCLAAAFLLAFSNRLISADADAPKAPEKDALFFESPEHAVVQTTDLLKKEDWPTLARYYDLTGTKTDPASLKSGEFFLRKEKPENAHPGLPWKYRHPFTPGYKFASVEETGVKGVVRVTVAISIDQGGGPAQKSVSTFDMRKRDRGYQILPEQVKAEKGK